APRIESWHHWGRRRFIGANSHRRDASRSFTERRHYRDATIGPISGRLPSFGAGSRARSRGPQSHVVDQSSIIRVRRYLALASIRRGNRVRSWVTGARTEERSAGRETAHGCEVEIRAAYEFEGCGRTAGESDVVDLTRTATCGAKSQSRLRDRQT